MPRAVGIAETGDFRGDNLNLSTRRGQWRCFWIATELTDHAAVPDLRRKGQLSVFPELGKIGRVDATLRQGVTRRLVEMFEPLTGAAAFGEGLCKSETFGQPGKDVVI